MTDEQPSGSIAPETPDAPEFVADRPSGDEAEVAPQYGVGPFTVRELALLALWVVAFVISFFPVSSFGPDSVWTTGIRWVLSIGVPTVAVFLVVLRRFSPLGIRRVGSLGVDQFASVAFVVAAAWWLQFAWESVGLAVANAGAPAYGWVVWVELVLMLGGVVLTVFAPFIPVLEQDFQGRAEGPAHRNARPVRAVTARPPVVRAPAPESTEETSPFAPVQEEVPQSTDDTPAAASPHHTYQAFWALAPEARDVVDENGVPLFRIDPTAWALVIEDRGSVFVVRHEDGRVGYLHDVSGITRG